MAKENVTKFYEELAKNEKLQNELKAAAEKAQLNLAEKGNKQAECIIAIAKNAGFDFTTEELLDESEVLSKKLTENELDNVAGGIGPDSLYDAMEQITDYKKGKIELGDIKILGIIPLGWFMRKK